MVSFYQLLGVNKDSSQDEIKQAYRERMKAHHPDRHGQSGDPIAPLIAEAYRVLGDPAERGRYNKHLSRNGVSSSTVILAHQSTTISPTSEARSREPCKKCDGRGYNPTLGVKWPCQYCGGRGWVPDKIAL